MNDDLISSSKNDLLKKLNTTTSGLKNADPQIED